MEADLRTQPNFSPYVGSASRFTSTRGQWIRQGDRLIVFPDDQLPSQDLELPQEAPPNPPARGQMSVPDPTANRATNPFAVPLRWMAKVSILKNGRYDQGGSGVLISDRHVLTAAHVVLDVVKNPAQYSVAVTVALDESKLLGTYLAAKKPDISSRYNPDTLDNDLAIITLSRPIANLKFPQLGGNSLCYWGSLACGAGTTAVPVDPGNLVRRVAYTAGYPKKHGGNQMWVFSGWLASVPPRSPIMVFRGETTEGQSGSPMWIRDGSGYNLVGVVVARGNVNRVIRLTWNIVEQLNGWMLAAEKRQ